MLGTGAELGQRRRSGYWRRAGEMPPASVALKLPYLMQVAPGGFHTCAVNWNETVRCAGAGGVGQPGYGDPLDRGGLPGQLPPPDVSYRLPWCTLIQRSVEAALSGVAAAPSSRGPKARMRSARGTRYKPGEVKYRTCSGVRFSRPSV